MEYFNIIDRLHSIAEQITPLAYEMLPENVEPRVLSIGAQLVYENPGLTDEELIQIAPKYILLPQNQIQLPSANLNSASDSDVYFATKSKAIRYSEEYYLDDESEEM
jgi:hypothetical protein